MSAAAAATPLAPLPDVIDRLAGIAPGSPLDAIRSRRPDARRHAQASYDALFGAPAGGAVTLAERWALAAFVTGLHGESAIFRHYEAGLEGFHPLLAQAVGQEARAARIHGPAGRYPDGPLSADSKPVPAYASDVAARTVLGGKLVAGFAHAHLLVFRPREASPSALQDVLNAGWTTDGIVTLSQIVAFLTFQIRVAAGFAALASE